MKIEMSRKSRLVFCLLVVGLLIFGAFRLPEMTQASPLIETQLLQNPGFESGSWSPWTNYGAPQLINSVSHAGPYSIQFGDEMHGDRVDDLAGQNITIPPDTTIATLSFWYQLQTQEVAANADKVCLGLYSTDFAYLYAENCVDIGVEGEITEWKQFTYALTQSQVDNIKGKTVMFGISFFTDWSLPSQGWVDDARLIVDNLPVDRLTYIPLVVNNH
jgi:hypothetical protein